MSGLYRNLNVSRIEQDEKHRKEILSLCRELKLQALIEVESFHGVQGDNNVRFYNSFRRLHDHLDEETERGVTELLKSAYSYDYNAETPANGYRYVYMHILINIVITWL